MKGREKKERAVFCKVISLSAEERRSGGTSSGHRRNEADGGDNQWPVGMVATPRAMSVSVPWFPIIRERVPANAYPSG